MFMQTDPVAHMVHSLVGQERDRQVTLGYTPEHDFQHSPADFQEMINRREYDALVFMGEGDFQRALQMYMQIGALAEAAMYQIMVQNKEAFNG
jgi:cobalamin biosynthesis Co2+ chelatase CbiK